MSRLDSRGIRLGYAALALFTGIAGDFWRDAISWYGWGAIVAVVIVGGVVLLAHNRRRFRMLDLPFPLLVFLLLALASVAWSDYRLFSLGGAVAQIGTSAVGIAIALTLSGPELLRVLGWVFRAVLGFSFVFEFIVSAFVRHPIYPVWLVPDDPAHPAKLLYWSRDLLFDFGKIQGIVGNSSLLGMAALLGLIVFAIQLMSKSVGRIAGWFWLAVALLAIVMTLSATVFIGLAAVVVVLLAVLLLRTARTAKTQGIRYAGIVIVAAAAVVTAILLRSRIFALLGKGDDATGRGDIWAKVIHVAGERPAAGWGWISYWVPDISPFKDLLQIHKGGVQVMHAHEAWLDVWLQLGALGLIVFGALILSTFIRSWLTATDRTVYSATDHRYEWVSALPVLMLTAQLVQSLAESRLLIEGGWMLLAVWATITKVGVRDRAPVTVPR